MKSIALILLLVQLAFAGVIRHELPASFKIIFDKDNVNTLSIGSAKLHVEYTNDTLIVSSSLGNMEIKNTNESFIVESVPSPSESQLDLDVKPENPKENEKYELQETTTVEPVKHNCMESSLKELIVKCDGNIRLREYTEEEKAKAKEERKKFEDQMKQRMKQFQDMFEMFEKNIKDLRPSLLSDSMSDFGNFQEDSKSN